MEKRTKWKILELKNTITKIINSLERLSNRMKMIGERNSEPDIILLKIIQSEQQRKKKRLKKIKSRTSGSDGPIARGLVLVSSDAQ